MARVGDGLDFARKAKYHDVVDIIVSQQRFIATMQGRTATFSTFSDAQFDEAAFEAQLTGGQHAHDDLLVLDPQAEGALPSGDYADALCGSQQGKGAALGRSRPDPTARLLFYSALTVAALYDNGSADEQTGWRDLLTAHQEQLREWAENYPPTFADKHALVSAEIARLEGRDTDAMHLYEQAIQSAREHGFVQNEGLAHEAAARFYAARGFERSRTCICATRVTATTAGARTAR